jgi:hypothetical protein
MAAVFDAARVASGLREQHEPLPHLALGIGKRKKKRPGTPFTCGAPDQEDGLCNRG